MNIEPHLVLIAKIGAAIAAIALIFKDIKPFFYSAKKFFSMPETIDRIEKETKANGGSSLRDAINRIEKRQLVQEHRILSLLDITTEISIFELDHYGNIIRSNTAFLTLIGKSADELIGHSWINNISHEDRDRIFKEFTEATIQKRMFSSVFYVKNGTTKCEIECKIQPVLTKDNEIISWLALLRKTMQF